MCRNRQPPAVAPISEGDYGGSGSLKNSILKVIVLGSSGSGKTSLLRRYFHGTFDPRSSCPSLGSDYYSTRVRFPPATRVDPSDVGSDWAEGNIEGGEYLNLQMWDTAGSGRRGTNQTARLSRLLGDAVFRNTDTAVIVYDATSSRSFAHVIRWRSELIRRMTEKKQWGGEGGEEGSMSTCPILVVANKLDLLRAHAYRLSGARRRSVPQRDVMGLKGAFQGRDHRYEYAGIIRPALSSGGGVDRVLGGRGEHGGALYYGLTDTESNWAEDPAYLAFVEKAEEASVPERDIVRIWCRRNGLSHVEASALDGEIFFTPGFFYGVSLAKITN